MLTDEILAEAKKALFNYEGVTSVGRSWDGTIFVTVRNARNTVPNEFMGVPVLVMVDEPFSI